MILVAHLRSLLRSHKHTFGHVWPLQDLRPHQLQFYIALSTAQSISHIPRLKCTYQQEMVPSSASKNNQLEYFVKSTSNWP